MEYEKLFSGEVRPPNVPPHWVGESLPLGQGWCWSNPQNRGDSVRLFRGDPEDPQPSKQRPYVLVTVNGILLGHDGRPTGEKLND